MVGRKKIVLTGGSHTGKTTLLEALRHSMPSAYFMSEPASNIIQSELDKANRDQSYVPVLPTTHYLDFFEKVIDESLRLEAMIPQHAQVVVLDRSLVDNIAYSRVNHHAELVDKVTILSRLAGYTLALLCDFVGTYQASGTRLEGLNYAQAIHSELQVAYVEMGIPLISIPPVAIDERVKIVKNIIEAS